MTHLRQQVTRNILTSSTAFALRIVISFLFIPFITATLGEARYGVWVIVFQTINYFVLFDFGLEKALLRFVSAQIGQRNFTVINRILNTAFSLYLIVGSVIIIGTWLTSTFLFDAFQVGDPGVLAEGKSALTIVGFYMGFRFFLLPFAGSLGGFQRYDLANGLNIAEELLRVGTLVWLLLNGYGLATLAGAIFGLSLLRQLAAIFWLRRLYPEISFDLKLRDRATTTELLNYSRITFGITLAWLIIFNTDSILLGLVATSAAAGIYAPGAQLMLYLRNAVNVAATPLTTAVSQMEAEGNTQGIGRLYLNGVRYASYLSFFLSVGVIAYARPFVALWLQPEFAAAAEVMRILAVSSAFFIPQIIGNAVLFGLSRHQVLLRVLVIEATVKIILSLILIPRFGLVGMAYAAAVPQLVLYVTYYPYLIGRTLAISPIVILMTSLRSGLMAMFLSLPAAMFIGAIVPPDSWPTLAANITVVTIPALAGAWLVLTGEDKARLRRRLPFFTGDNS